METEKIKDLPKNAEAEFQCGKRKIDTEDQGSPAKLKKTDLQLKQLQPNTKAPLQAIQTKQLELCKKRQLFGKENFATNGIPDSSSQCRPEREGDSYNDNESVPHRDDEDKVHKKSKMISPSSQSGKEDLSDTDHGAPKENKEVNEMKRLLQEKEAALQVCREEKDARLSEWIKANNANADFEKQLAFLKERCHILQSRGKEKNAKLKEQKQKLESQTAELHSLKAKCAGMAKRETAKTTKILHQKERLEYLESFLEHMQAGTRPQRRGIDP